MIATTGLDSGPPPYRVISIDKDCLFEISKRFRVVFQEEKNPIAVKSRTKTILGIVQIVMQHSRRCF